MDEIEKVLGISLELDSEEIMKIRQECIQKLRILLAQETDKLEIKIIIHMIMRFLSL